MTNEIRNYQSVDEKTITDYLFASNNDKLTSAQKTLFMNIAIQNNLNPFKREIFAIPYGNNLTVVTSYTVYLQRASASGKLDGWNIEMEKQDGKIIGGKIIIFRKDMKNSIEHSVSFSEISQNNTNWQKKPEFMTRKTLISQGMRLAFPEFMAGMPYTEDEIGETQYQQVEIIQQPKAVEKIEEQKVEVDENDLSFLDQEIETLENEKITDAQSRKIHAQWAELGFNSLKDRDIWQNMLFEIFGFKSSTQLSKTQASNLIEILEKSDKENILEAYQK